MLNFCRKFSSGVTTAHGNLKIIYKMQAKSYRNIFRVYQNQDNFSTELEPREGVMSQTSFSHILINSSMFFTILTTPKSSYKDLLINTSHVSRRSILAKLLRKSVDNC